AQDWPAFAKLVERMRQGKTTWPVGLELVQEWYAQHLDRIYDDAPLRAADVEQLGQIAAGYGSPQRFLTELTLDPPEATSGRAGADLKDEDYTVLSTIHSAKGQERRIVRILNVVDGCIPSDRATGTSEEIEEERRLLYVAMTRAKDELDLIVPHRFFTHQQAKLGDRHVYASRSRFIPDSILGWFAVRNWRDQTDDAIQGTRRVDSSVDVAASLMRMWR